MPADGGAYATFALAKPVDLAKSSGVLVYTVVNRGSGAVSGGPEGHICSSAAGRATSSHPQTIRPSRCRLLRNADGSPITGLVLARFADIAPGTTTIGIRLSSMGTDPPVPPATLDQANATLT